MSTALTEDPATCTGRGIIGDADMQEVRCGHCSRKLAVAEYVRLDIKCPRCGTLNVLRAESPKPERRRASPVGSNDDPQQKRPAALSKFLLLENFDAIYNWPVTHVVIGFGSPKTTRPKAATASVCGFFRSCAVQFWRLGWEGRKPLPVKRSAWSRSSNLSELPPSFGSVGGGF